MIATDGCEGFGGQMSVRESWLVGLHECEWGERGLASLSKEGHWFTIFSIQFEVEVSEIPSIEDLDEEVGGLLLRTPL